VYIPSKRTAVVEVPKCASTSLISAIGRCHSVSDAGEHFTLLQHQQKNPEMELGVALIREPLARLRSGVEFCLQMRGSMQLSEVRNELMQSLLDGRPSQASVVLYPQYSFLLCDIPARFYLLENIALLTGSLGVASPPPIKNKTKKILRPDQAVAAFGEDFVREFYALDFAIYDSLCSTEGGLLEVRSAKEYIFSLREGCP
jgi:hypothetical protein